MDKFLEEGIALQNTNSFEEIVQKLCTSLENQCVADQSIEKEYVEHAIEVTF